MRIRQARGEQVTQRHCRHDQQARNFRLSLLHQPIPKLLI